MHDADVVCQASAASSNFVATKAIDPLRANGVAQPIVPSPMQHAAPAPQEEQQGNGAALDQAPSSEHRASSSIGDHASAATASHLGVGLGSLPGDRLETGDSLTLPEPADDPLQATAARQRVQNPLYDAAAAAAPSASPTLTNPLFEAPRPPLEAALPLGESEEPVLEAIFVYPIKSCAGFSPREWPLGPNGLLFDREWALMDESGVGLTQRRLPSLVTLRPRLDLAAGEPVPLVWSLLLLATSLGTCTAAYNIAPSPRPGVS